MPVTRFCGEELPGGTEKPVALEQDPDLVLQWKKSNGDVLCEVSYDNVPSPTERGRFLVALQPTTYIDQPTANIESGNSLAPSGAWLINIEKSEKQVGDLNDDENPLLHAWVQRDETLYGHPRRGRQSFFSDDCYERFDHGGREIDDDEHREQPLCHIKREGLINALATGKKTVVVGGYFEKEMVSANYSAGGPVTPSPGSPNAHRDGPDAVAVSDQSRVHRGVLAAGSRSGTVVAMSGTSVAAPQVTRLIADRLAKRKSGNRDAVKELVERGGGRHSKKREGEGRIPRPKRIKFSRVWD